MKITLANVTWLYMHRLFLRLADGERQWVHVCCKGGKLYAHSSSALHICIHAGLHGGSALVSPWCLEADVCCGHLQSNRDRGGPRWWYSARRHQGLLQSREQRCVSRDTNSGLAGGNLRKGLGSFCCNINSVNAMLSSAFPIDLLAYVASVLNHFFPRTYLPILWYLKTSGLCRLLLLGSKKVPQILGCSIQP